MYIENLNSLSLQDLISKKINKVISNKFEIVLLFAETITFIPIYFAIYNFIAFVLFISIFPDFSFLELSIYLIVLNFIAILMDLKYQTFNNIVSDTIRTVFASYEYLSYLKFRRE